MKIVPIFLSALLIPGLVCVAQEVPPATAPAAPTPASADAPAVAPAPVPVAAPAMQAPATPNPAAQAAGPASDSYVIGASDVLAITVWRDTTLSGSVLVRPDGMISMPLLGDVMASGLTPLQLANQISAKLRKYIQEPNVSVVVSAIHSKIVYLLGEVAKKGPLEMTPDMTMLRAIASAGGLTDYANSKKIYILRQVGGKNTRIPVHYKDALKGKSALDIVLLPGDTIVVP